MNETSDAPAPPSGQPPNQPPNQPPPARPSTLPPARSPTGSVGEPPARPEAARSPWMPLLALAVVILAASNGVLWWRTGQAPPPTDPPPGLTTIQARVAQLEQAGASAPSQVLTRIEALEQKLNRPAAETDAAALAARLDAIDQRVTADLGPLLGRLEALEQRPTATPDGLQTRVEALEQRRVTDLVALQARITAAEQKAAADLESTTSRVAAIETTSIRDLSDALGRITALEQRTRDDQKNLSNRVELLEKRPMPDLTPIQERLARLEQRPIPDPRTPDRLDALAGRLEGLTARTEAASGDVGRRIDAVDTRIAKIETAVARVPALDDRITRLARMRHIELALAQGQKLGPVPNAPPALARFADAAPPTQAGLRLAFPAVERAVRAAHRPDDGNASFSENVWNRVQDLVTVRHGDQVLIGHDVDGILARARTALDAGDLAGTVSAMTGLTGSAAKPAAEWLSDAKALLDARAALASMPDAG